MSKFSIRHTHYCSIARTLCDSVHGYVWMCVWLLSFVGHLWGEKFSGCQWNYRDNSRWRGCHGKEGKSGRLSHATQPPLARGKIFGVSNWFDDFFNHYTGVIMGAVASQVISLTIVYSTVYSDADQRKHQSSASLAFVRGIHRRPVNSPHKWPVTRKMFPFGDVIMI